MAMHGVRTTEWDNLLLADTLLANRNDTSGQITTARLAAQLSAIFGPTVGLATDLATEDGLAWDEDTIAKVVADGSQNGVWKKNGPAGAGNWTKIGPLPEADLGAIEVDLDAIRATRIIATGLAAVTAGGTLGGDTTISVPVATNAEALAGLLTDKAVVPSTLKVTVDAAIDALINGAPGALNALNELAAALGNDANFAATTAAAFNDRALKTIQIVATGLAGVTAGGTLAGNTTINVPAATDAETLAGLLTNKAVVPAGLKVALDAAVSGLINGAPGALNALNELAAALGNDANFATTTATAIGERALKTVQIAASGLAVVAVGGTLAGNTTIHVPVATNAEALAGLLTDKAVVPSTLKVTVDAAIDALINGAPGALNALNELAAALGNDANFAATTAAALNDRALKTIQIVATGLAGVSAGGTLAGNTTINVPAATDAETLAGVIANKAVVPSGLKVVKDGLISSIDATSLIHLTNIGGTGDAITAEVPASATGLNSGHIATFVPLATNSALRPTLTVGGFTRELLGPAGEYLAAFALVPGTRYSYHVTGPGSARIISGDFAPGAVAKTGVLRTETAGGLVNTIVVNPLGIYDNQLLDGQVVEVKFSGINLLPPVLKVGTNPTFPICNEYGIEIPANSTRANEVAHLIYKASPAPHFRWPGFSLRQRVQNFQTRAIMETAVTGGAVLPAEPFMLAGLNSAGDGGQAMYSTASQVFRSAAGAGVLVDVTTPARALGVTSVLDGVKPPDGKVPLQSALARQYPDAAAQLPLTGYYLLRGADQPRLHQISFSGSGGLLEIDASTIPINQPFRISSRHMGTSHVVIDAGYSNKWTDFADQRYIDVPSGTSLIIERSKEDQFVIVASREVYGLITGLADFARSPRTKTILTVGQSLMTQAFNYGWGAGWFQQRYAELVANAKVNFICAARGGSGICERDGPPVGNWWVDMSNPEAPADGPLLIEAEAIIANRAGDLSQPQISAIIWDQGQTTAGVIDTPQNPNPSMTQQMYKDATTYALARLRSMAGGSVPVIFQRLGRSTLATPTPSRWQAIRRLQLEIIEDEIGVHLGPETWDLPYKDSLHPDYYGQLEMGRRLAEAVASVEGVAGVHTYLTISAAVYTAATRTITVTVTGGSLRRFQDPTGFTVHNAAGVKVTIARIHWVSTTQMRLFLTADATGGMLYFLYGAGDEIDETAITRIVISPSYQFMTNPIRPGAFPL
ncbi:hypothetical protein [Pararhizobium gei]|uniref:hypothetical protein n=1 Tax=Pararhizobium gei TaxID=1395951 RepID=UPI0023DC3D6A|nr:hypothetical protein [Rhizobium gei]